MHTITINRVKDVLPRIDPSGVRSRNSYVPYLDRAHKMRPGNCITLDFDTQPSCNTFYTGLLTNRKRYPKYSHIKIQMRGVQVFIHKPTA